MAPRKKKPAAEDDVAVEELEAAAPDDDDDEGAPPLEAFLDPAWRPPPAKSAAERKVTNKYIPLFPDATKDPKRHAASIKVYKQNPPNEGYKGTIDSPETVDEALIAGLYGDGRYKLELCDQAKTVLRTRDNVVISIGAPSPSNGSNGHGSTDVEGIVAKLTAQSEAALAKVLEATEKRLEREEKRLSDERAAERARSTEHTTVMTSLVKGEAEQLRAHYAAQQQASDKGSQMLLMMMTQAHQQNMQMMMAMQQAQASRSDPLLFLKVFQEGMNNASEDTADKVTGNIVKGLESLRGLAGAEGQTKRLPASTGAPPATTAITKKANPGGPAKAAEKEVSKEELLELVLLKRTFKARGMEKEFLTLVKQARAHYSDPNTPIEEFVDDDDEELEEEPAPKKKAKKKPDDADADPAEKPADAVDGEGSPDA